MSACYVVTAASLLSFFAQHGHTNVPSNYEDKTLAIWIKCQRHNYRLFMSGQPSNMTPERIAKLKSLRLVRDPRKNGRQKNQHTSGRQAVVAMRKRKNNNNKRCYKKSIIKYLHV